MMEFPLQSSITEAVIQYQPIYYNSRDNTNPQVLLEALTPPNSTCYLLERMKKKCLLFLMELHRDKNVV